MPTCKRVHYSGTVQGVGFRMTAKRIADGFAVVGYVRNLGDGRVEMVVHGEAGEVERFLGAVARRMASYIQGQSIDEVAAEPLTTFEIRI